MGCCLCAHFFDNDNEMSHKQQLQTQISAVKNRITAKKLPVIWMDGHEGSGMHSHGCNIAERFGYAHIPLDSLIQDECEKFTSRARLVKAKVHTKRKLPNRIIMDLIKENMIQAGDSTRGYLISGFPITPRQANMFVREVAPVDCVIILEGHLKGKDTSYPIEKPTGDRKTPETERKDEKYSKDVKGSTSKFDFLIEKINTNEPPADVFLKIEAAILDRLASNPI